MSKRRYSQLAGKPEEPGTDAKSGPYTKSAPIRVSFGVYIISLIVVALVVFILMLVQYFPGYRNNYQLASAVKGADYVYVGIRIPKEELKKRKINPLTKEDDVVKMLQKLGAKRATVNINPDKTLIPGE
jgi:hypothetical protein